jgi:DNA-binding NarL/FixJ family response regulator
MNRNHAGDDMTQIEVTIIVKTCCACVGCHMPKRLTMREQDVAELLAEGKRQREIAESLVITERTVRHHEASIVEKLGVRNRFEAALRL